MASKASVSPGLGFSQSPLLPIVGILAAVVSIQYGATIAKSLFPIAGAEGTTALRLTLCAILLTSIVRPWRAKITRQSWPPILLYGAALGGMNLLFYMALRTLPLGITVALEFLGPLAVAMVGARRPIDFLWIGLAVTGLLLLLPVGTSVHALDPIGVALALGAGGCWALYIIFGKKAALDHGVTTVALGTMIAAAVVLPFGIAEAGTAMFSPSILPAALAVAVLSSALPYTLELAALRRLRSHTFGTLMSLEPAVGALVGFAVLGENLPFIQWLAIAFIVLASAGTAVAAKSGA
ncbi:threonine/homoserine exporter RhtA [Rhodoligotrophos ferricapiens]|uniref:threonine/homoserine exporter RhtA n=1 Tax=Rhodoligotrophos ferricapiens TaxID=3069264 RepID=UPI00315CE668